MARPPKYKTPEELQEKLEAYFEDKKRKVWSIESLVAHLGMTRQSLLNYAEKDEFIDILKDAKAKILGSQIDGAMTGLYSVPMTIFLLKNNHKYTDRQEIEQKTEVQKITYEILPKK